MSESIHWPAAATALWARLSAHPFAVPADGLDLTRRLAREQGWTGERARDTIEEYRRFCFLCCVAGEPMTPSQEVDAVWHLHLTYTRDYWERFCPLVLGTPLHHGPTRGGLAEGRRYRAQYARTLAAYERWFGPPPLAFWPGTQERFADPARWRQVDLHRHLILPRPRLPGRRGWLMGAGLAVGVLAAGTAAALPLNPLDWTAAPFLTFFVPLGVLALVLSSRWGKRHRETGPGRADGLDHYQLAYLEHGPARAVDTGATELLTLGLARLDDWPDWPPRLRLTVAALPERLSDLGAAVVRNGKPKAVLRNAAAWLAPIRDSLVSRGLALSAQQVWRFRRDAALPLLAVAAFGVAKILVGMSRERPVGAWSS